LFVFKFSLPNKYNQTTNKTGAFHVSKGLSY